MKATPPLPRLKSVKKGVSDADFRDKIVTLLMIATEGFKAALACLLVVLVPQLCPAEPDSPDPSKQYPHSCSEEENFDVLEDAINLAALIFNFVTFAFLMLHYWTIWNKERFMIEFLDTDPNVPQTHLETVLGQYDRIRAGFYWHNDRVFGSFAIVAVLFVVNIVLSAIVVHQYYSDFRSVTVFATNLLVIVSIMKRSSTASWAGRDRTAPQAISVMTVAPIRFNQIDADHIAKDKEPQPTPIPIHIPAKPEQYPEIKSNK